jgi:16S rRNA processing protein RimM
VLAPDAWVPLADVARPHGVRGELRLRLFNGDSDLLLDLEEVLLRFAAGNGTPGKAREQVATVEGARRANDAILMKLRGVDDRTQAEALRSAVVCARRGDFPPLEDDEFYVCDVEGARVVVDGGEELGQVIELKSYPTLDVLVVTSKDGGRPWEVPLVEAVVRRVDVGAGVVTLATLEGVERS